MNQNTIRPIGERKRPIVKLAGVDGNVFAITGRTRCAMRNVGWSKAEISAAVDEMMNGDYDHLLRTVGNLCEVN